MKPDPAFPDITLHPAFFKPRPHPTLRDGSRMGRREARFWRGEIRLSNRQARLRPGDPVVFYFRGIAKMRLGRPGPALRDFDHSIALDSGSAGEHFERGNALLDLGRYAESIEAYDRAIGLDPGRSSYGLGAVTFYNRGLAKSKLDLTEEAIADYGRALSTNPLYVDALNNRGHLLVRLAHFEEALADFDDGIIKAPRDSLIHANRADVLLRLGRPEEALAACDRALAIRPRESVALYNKASALARMGDPDGARHWLLRAVAADPQNAKDARENPDLVELPALRT